MLQLQSNRPLRDLSGNDAPNKGKRTGRVVTMTTLLFLLHANPTDDDSVQKHTDHYTTVGIPHCAASGWLIYSFISQKSKSGRECIAPMAASTHARHQCCTRSGEAGSGTRDMDKSHRIPSLRRCPCEAQEARGYCNAGDLSISLTKNR
jgi:hypothetical protein